jgi:hypothetical protein
MSEIRGAPRHRSPFRTNGPDRPIRPLTLIIILLWRQRVNRLFDLRQGHLIRSLDILMLE